MAGPINAGFWSYTHSDDEHENGRIGRLRERLERSIRFYSGIRDFRIFLDRKDIGWGQKWAGRIADSLDDALLLFPLMTPSYFSSAPCREEALAFRTRQSRLRRDDLILPIYYLASDLMDNTADSTFAAEEREVGKLLREHQHEDWRALRVTEETDPSYGMAIERLAQQATKALKRDAAAHGHSRGRPETAAETSNPATALPTGDDRASSASAAGETSPKAASGPPGHIVSLTVNQMPGRANFATISDAIARAPGGARIVVAPGHYRESLVIDKPLELVGDGSREDIVIESQTAHTVIFDTNIGLVRNFTLRQSRLKGDDYCVWIKQGRLELEDCDISSAGRACIAITNNADPRIRRNKIHNSNQSGVYIADARGTLEDNEIFENSHAGIGVTKGADPIVRRNRVHDGKQSGIFVYEDGRGTFEDNEVFGNSFAGIEVKEGADPIVRRNRIHDGRQGGILVDGDGRGTFEDNEIFRNSLAGIEVRAGADPIVRRNRIHDGTDGILVIGEGRGTFEDNDIFGNSVAGIEVREGNPIVRRNRINKNAYEAIWVHEDGAGTFTDNDLTGNARGAWDLHSAAMPRVKRERNRENDALAPPSIEK